MNVPQFIFDNIRGHLLALGLDEGNATSCARKGVEHYTRKVGSSKNPFNEACDEAGRIASSRVPSFRYVSPKAKGSKRVKRPQEAFDFGGR